MLTIPVYFTFKELLEAEEEGKSLIVPCRGEEVCWEETYLDLFPQTTEDLVVRDHNVGVGFKQCEDAVPIDDNGKHWFIEGDFNKNNEFHLLSAQTDSLLTVENFLEKEIFPSCSKTELKTALEKIPLLMLDQGCLFPRLREEFTLSFAPFNGLEPSTWGTVSRYFDSLGDFLTAFDLHN